MFQMSLSLPDPKTMCKEGPIPFLFFSDRAPQSLLQLCTRYRKTKSSVRRDENCCFSAVSSCQQSPWLFQRAAGRGFPTKLIKSPHAPSPGYRQGDEEVNVSAWLTDKTC